jgi:hypothetical protein
VNESYLSAISQHSLFGTRYFYPNKKLINMKILGQLAVALAGGIVAILLYRALETNGKSSDAFHLTVTNR